MRIFVLFFCFSTVLNAQKSKFDYNKKAINFYQIGNYDSALFYFNKQIELYPFDTLAYIDRAITKEMLMDYMGSIADYSRLAIIDSLAVDAYFLRGTAFYHLGFIDAAYEDFQHSILLENDNAYAYYFIGKILLQKKKRNIAIKYFKTAIQHNKTHSEALYELAKYQYDQKKYEIALEYLDKSIEAFPRSETYKLKCILSFKTNNFNNAAFCLEKLAKINIKELQEVIKICNQMNKKRFLNQYFSKKDTSDSSSNKSMFLVYILAGDFSKANLIYLSLSKTEKENDFLLFLKVLSQSNRY